MNSSAISKFLVIALALTVSVVGCKKRPQKVTPIPAATSRIGEEGPMVGEGLTNTTNAGPSATDLASDEGIKQAPLDTFEGMTMDRDAFKAETVYFDFDRSGVRPSETHKLETVAERLNFNPANKVLIEGHCDERGTEEYNRALGERRALALREFLVRLGISPDRIRTISYGEDKPAVQGHDEEAWAKNRRGEFVLLTPP